MAISYVVARFSKPGKGFPQVPQTELVSVKDEKTGEVTTVEKPILEDGKPVIGNEQYNCNQLSDDSIASDSVEHFVEDVLASTEGNLKLAAEMFREGWNRSTRLSAAGLDEYQKAAKGVIKLKLEWTKGLSVDQVAEKLKALNS